MINLIYVLNVHTIMSLHEIPGIKKTHFLVNCNKENTELLKEICKMIKKSNAKINALETKVKELKYFTDIDFTTDDEDDNEDDEDEEEDDEDDDSISDLSTEVIHNKTYTIMKITENNSFFLELMKGPSELNDRINKLQEKIYSISNKIYPNPLYTKQDDGSLTRRDIYGNKRFIPKYIILEDWKQKPTLLNLKCMSHQSILSYLNKNYNGEEFTIKTLNCELEAFLIKNYKINDKTIINSNILLKFFTDYLKKKNKTIIKYNKKGSKIIYYNVWECHSIVTHILNIYKEQ